LQVTVKQQVCLGEKQNELERECGNLNNEVKKEFWEVQKDAKESQFILKLKH
jgi:hypothetical protein